MLHYHFHLHNAHEAIDEEGLDLPDMAQAYAKALAGIRDLVGHEAMGGVIDLRGRLDIADDAGTVLKSVPFMEAFTVRLADE